ncbi:MAG: hypothetical protein LBE36_09785 [Flavobacteriaceae bacterium]|jgi:protein required for attachment to host cells|nr:hypothetical protein [Flavobacteriaceae bacterium]
MKKTIIVLCVAVLIVSCKKMQAGGNKGSLKNENIETYADDAQSHQHETAAKSDTATVPSTTPETDSVNTDSENKE